MYLLNGADAKETGRARRFYKSRRVVIVIVMLVMLLIVSVYVGVFQLRQKPSATNLATFTCQQFFGNETFTITAAVNVNDGIDQDEAIEIATIVFGEAFKIDANYELKSMSTVPTCDEHGKWTVDFNVILRFARLQTHQHAWESGSVHRYFKVVVDPLGYTILYGSS